MVQQILRDLLRLNHQQTMAIKDDDMDLVVEIAQQIDLKLKELEQYRGKILEVHEKDTLFQLQQVAEVNTQLASRQKEQAMNNLKKIRESKKGNSFYTNPYQDGYTPGRTY